MLTIRPTSALVSAIVLVTTMLFLPPQLRAASIGELVEQYGLTGVWAPDCTRPASQQNPHVVYRLRAGDRLEREISIASDKAFEVNVAVSIAETGVGELTMVWETREGEITNRVRAYPGQMQVLDSTRENGEKLFVNGRRTSDNAVAPKYHKCS